MPRTVFYDRFCDAVRRHPAFQEAGAELLIPAEETANETNWPRYGNPDSAYVRGGRFDLIRNDRFARYLDRVVAFALEQPDKNVLVLNMHPFLRLPMRFRPHANIIVADGSLAGFERALNPRTISMPALPLVRAADAQTPRTVLASFQGAASHPVRHALLGLHDGKDFVIRLTDPKDYARRIDAENGVTDAAYEELLDRSVFALVPRGDSLFSYRLLEAMARGAIPVILSDGWVLPFDRTVDWASCSVRMHQEAVPRIPEVLRAFTPQEIAAMQANMRDADARVFQDMDRIVQALLWEAEMLRA